MAVPFVELKDSPKESYGPNGFSAVRRILCEWQLRGYLVDEIIRQNYEFTESSYPGQKNIVADTIDIEPYGVPPDEQTGFVDTTRHINNFWGKAALVTIHYMQQPVEDPVPLDLNRPGISWFVYEQDHSMSRRKLPKGLARDLMWRDAGIPVIHGEVVSRVYWLPLVIHRLSWRRVQNPPWDVINLQTGTINSETFIGIVAGQLLFEGIKTRREYMSQGRRFDIKPWWRIDFVFIQKKTTMFQGAGGVVRGWNHFMRINAAGGPIFDVPEDDDGHGMYVESNFNDIFAG